MTREEVKEILERHQHWIKEDCDGWEGMKADLRRADLRGADLSFLNLRWLNLARADMRGANLTNANLSNADMYGADLRGATLLNTYLFMSDLRYADLSFADVNNACFTGTELYAADLFATNLRNANIRDAHLSCAKNVPFIPLICPDHGAFIGFKKAEDNSGCGIRHVIVVLEIPSDAKRSSGTTRKCRCDKAKVLAIQNFDGTAAEIKAAYSLYKRSFAYKVGETVSVDDFDENRWNECSTGIHFFINREEAVRY